ncbi:MAG: hypothetical protein A2X46_19115 [Lentisphaerae bacterium GWF2_57_35]|nr:MAG: hypothetical protein A2X46_19115 [Lentisphaerae bacterium GWF2_57_35]
MKKLLSMCGGLLILVGGSAALASDPIYVTYLWHMHQPIYFPYKNINDTTEYNFSVPGVFDGDRTAAYQHWPKDAVQQGADRNMPNAGAQVSFSGSLGENANNLWGYNSWPGAYRWARNSLRTARNNPRLDLVGIPYHHSLMPLTCKESMIMQIKLHKEQYKDVWDTGGSYSKGFWPPECAFSESIIPALVEEGLEWVIVDNGHLFRTVPDFAWNDGSSCRPNPADVINPSSTDLGSQWVQLQNVWAPTKVLAPWSYQPHYVQYVNPTSGQIQKIVAVPAGRYEGNENGRGGYGAFKPENVWGSHMDANNGSKPMLLLCHSDGDNYGMKNSDAWNGQHSAFLNMCQSNPDFDTASVQDYLDMYPPNVNDVIHVEPGSWIGIDGGTPYFEKWLSSTYVNGENPDRWSWSVLVAAQNRVILADSLENSYSMNDVEWGIGSDTAKAWHFYLNGETSCYWYWDMDRANPWDGNVTRACNMAVAEAQKVISRHSGVDAKGPSIFPPQRSLYNPGGKMWNEASPAASDFEVWSYVDDVSGLNAVKLCWRTDKDGFNPLSSIDNETYAGGSDVNAWNTETMSGSWDPSVKGPDNIVPNPTCRAQMYKASILGQNNVLIDYFVEGVDTKGNTNRSDIMHVYVGQSSGGAPVAFSPTSPRDCDPLVVTYNSAGRSLSAANPVTLMVTFDNWTTTNEYAMSGATGGYWRYTNAIPGGAAGGKIRFRNGATVDNNSGQDWSIAISHCSTPSATTFSPAAPNGCDPVLIRYQPNEGVLSNASPLRIHVGYNGWQGVPNPDPAMTNNAGTWEYWFYPPGGVYQIDCCFNNGGAIWDSNNGQDYNVAVSDCSSTNVVASFNPAAPRDCDLLTVTFNAEGTALSAATQVFATLTFDQWAHYSHHRMQGGAGMWSYQTAVPADSPGVTANFRDLSNDVAAVVDNSGANWSAIVSTCNTGPMSTIRFAYGSPAINEAGNPNNAGDNFDFVATGGAAQTKGSSGFGSFGRVYVNYDATYFYVGGEGVDMVGANNGMIVFLAFDSLACNAGTLENFNGVDPYALDKMHNVAFSPAMDLAIILGDVWGDGTATNFDLNADPSMPFGQGVFKLNVSHHTFDPLYEARVSQFDGAGANACVGNYDSGDRLMTRWECRIPWSELEAPNGIDSITNVYIAGLFVSSGVVTNKRYVSGKFFGDSSTSGAKDEYGSFGYSSVILNGMAVGKPAGDFDHDGMPDEWETYRFGDTATAGEDSDFDQDGFSDRDEYLASTDPKSFWSCFEAHHAQMPTAQGFPVRWSSVSGKRYDVLASTNLLPGANAVAIGSDILATPPDNTFTATVDHAEAKFYWIRTRE